MDSFKGLDSLLLSWSCIVFEINIDRVINFMGFMGVYNYVSTINQ